MKVPLLAGFLALIVLLTADVVMTNRTIARLQLDQRRITELQAERFELEALLRVYVDAETGQRGFILTGDEKFLEPYEAARKKLAAGDVRLKAMLGSDHDLASMAAEIKLLGAQKMRELDALIGQRRTGNLTEIAARVQEGEGKRIMDEIRRVAADIDHRKAAEVARVIVLSAQCFPGCLRRHRGNWREGRNPLHI